mmetsp:Transcript_23789/g.62223  ORF Transcript_23789/g.62223 Transcript_23789/m.62223 type:complete len:204 (+) Transcript_23789:124-735(+)|eukprot:CAMPEP_0182918946 /NCGR_PEP_ID=MMETSP0105_2-20130417/2384_1 /TAXON_ID=81532 ORGANISM="Acanthoeca-like sp., Strain 10tr" /NCGR_SAMPLE_ID=MMETSP0105_2 /ASSEMBLY_ACC=CAM_ASM_000205 /LENGTH=203 /DNA_ID=CAMNT_0025056071 /DNA_START=124 /DNA_END=735 /DNA_ORIENTATION=-
MSIQAAQPAPADDRAAMVAPSFDPSELFDICDTDNKVTGQAPRGRVHAEGLYHRSVQVVVLDRAGRMLLQRRSPTKDVAPGCWDLSCAEHLQPSEAYRAAAARGLEEELGIPRGPPSDGLTQVLPAFLQDNAYPHAGKIDREFVECYLLADYDGPITLDGVEVVESKWIAATEAHAFASARENAAPWFVDTMSRLRAALPGKF